MVTANLLRLMRRRPLRISEPAKILEDLFKEHNGRIFNTAGDSVLAEFSSAVSAVICATEFQRLIKERNESETTDLKNL